MNLVLELLRAIRGDIAELRGVLRDHGHRLNRIELAVTRLRERAVRIAPRLDIHDA